MFDARLFRVALAAALVVSGSLALAGAASAQTQVTLTVTVVDQNGDPVSNVDIYASWNDGSGGPVEETTRANGQALVDVPEGEDIRIYVDDDDYVKNYPVVVTDASSESVEVQVAPAATATVTVVDNSGARLADTRVRLFRGGNYVTNQRTDADGRVTTPPVEAGTYTVIANKPGFYRNLTETEVRETTEQTVTMREGSALVTFNVYDDHFNESRALRNATISVGSVGSVQTLSNGEATISVPVNTQHQVTVDRAGYESVTRQLTVAESQQTVNVSIARTPELTITPDNRRVVVNETVRLTVTNEYNESVVNATVTRDGEEIGMTDADGRIIAPVPSAGNTTFVAERGDLSANVTVEGVEPGGMEETETESTPTETTGLAGPGFTPIVAVLAVLVVAALLARRD